MALAIEFGADAIAAAIWRTPAAEAGAGVVIENSDATGIVAAMHAFLLRWISEEQDGVLSDCCKCLAYCGATPTE